MEGANQVRCRLDRGSKEGIRPGCTRNRVKYLPTFGRAAPGSDFGGICDTCQLNAFSHVVGRVPRLSLDLYPPVRAEAKYLSKAQYRGRVPIQHTTIQNT